MRSGSRPRASRTPLTGLSPSPSRVNFTLLAVVLVLILLPLIAFASPLDPFWIAGIYDGADGDDIVMLVYDTLATSAPAPPPMLRLPCPRGISTTKHIVTLSDSQCAEGSRAPPAMFSAVSAHVSIFRTRFTPTASATKFPLVTRRSLGVHPTTAPALATRMF